MYTGLVHLHNFLRWVILLLLLVALVRHFVGMTGKKAYTSGDRKVDLFLMISAHIQGLIGIIQWFIGDWGLKLLRNSDGMSEVMKNAPQRFWIVEHPVGMIISIVLITIGRKAARHNKAFWLFLIALIVIMASVPWPGRAGIARPMF